MTKRRAPFFHKYFLFKDVGVRPSRLLNFDHIHKCPYIDKVFKVLGTTKRNTKIIISAIYLRTLCFALFWNTLYSILIKGRVSRDVKDMWLQALNIKI